MAIGAEHPQIFQAMVLTVAVYVVDLDAQRTPAPLVDSALVASVLEQPGRDQATLNVGAVSPALHQLRERHAGPARHEFAAAFGLVPSHRAKTESGLALPVGMALVVVGLDGVPVVTAATVGHALIICERAFGVVAVMLPSAEIYVCSGLYERRAFAERSLVEVGTMTAC